MISMSKYSKEELKAMAIVFLDDWDSLLFRRMVISIGFRTCMTASEVKKRIERLAKGE